jgi:hypothetical protein
MPSFILGFLRNLPPGKLCLGIFAIISKVSPFPVIFSETNFPE